MIVEDLKSKPTRRLKIASINSFFDGVDVNPMSVWDWIMLHAHMFVGNPSVLKKHQERRKGPHPLEQIIEKHQPDVVAVNEIIQTPWGSKAQDLLKKHGYTSIAYGRDPTHEGNFHRMTAVATRFPSKQVETKVKSFPGGRFCALEADNWVFVGVQGCPFYDAARIRQIKRLFEQCEEFQKEHCRVIVAGDFNTDIEAEDLCLPDHIQHVSGKTFPHRGFYDRLSQKKSLTNRWTQKLLHLKHGPRALDHILVSDSEKITNHWIEETSSDHLSVIAEIEVPHDFPMQ